MLSRMLIEAVVEALIAVVDSVRGCHEALTPVADIAQCCFLLEREALMKLLVNS